MLSPTHAQAIDLEELITCPKEICDLFKKTHTKRFYSIEHGFPSYSAIQGADPLEIPDGIPIENRTYPVYNRTEKDTMIAIKCCEKLVRKLLSDSAEDKVEISRREYMIEGSTNPIRITAYLTSNYQGKIKSSLEHIYVKQMNVNRIFGAYLYGIITDVDTGFLFSEQSIFEPEIRGKNINSYKPKEILDCPKLRKELIKLSLQAYITGISDLDNPYNIIITPDKKMRIIDFDKMFWDINPNPRERLLNPFEIKQYSYDIEKKTKTYDITEFPYERIKDAIPKKEINEVIDQEKERLYQNIRFMADEYLAIADAMRKFRYYNSNAETHHGEKDISTFYLHKMTELRSNSL